MSNDTLSGFSDASCCMMSCSRCMISSCSSMTSSHLLRLQS
jgi:hypothetical protein